MARRYSFDKSGGSETKSGGATQQKALADVDVQGDDDGEVGGFALNFFGDSGTDRELTQEGAIEAYHRSAPLHMAVRAVSRAVGEVDYGWEDDGPSEFSLKRPNRWHQSAEHFGLCAAYLMLGGEYVAIKNETARGVELWPVPPHDVEEPETPSGRWQIEDGAVGGLSRTQFDRDELLIIHEPSLLDPFMHGRGSGQVLGHDADIHEAAGEHTATYLENYARPDAILGADGMDPDEADRLEDSMQMKHGGPSNAGQLQVLGTDIDVETLTQPLDDIGAVELRKASAKLCLQVFGVVPIAVGMVEDVNRASAEVQERIFQKNTVKPLVSKIVEAHQTQLVDEDLGGQTITTGQIVPSDTKRQMQLAEEHPGAVYVNEARQAAGYDARDEFDDRTLADVMPAQPAPQQRGRAPRSTSKKNHPAGWSSPSRPTKSCSGC